MTYTDDVHRRCTWTMYTEMMYTDDVHGDDAQNK